MITSGDFTAVLKSLGAGSGLVLPAADLALGASKALTGLSPVSQAVFLATMTQESGCFRYTEEIRKNGSYAPYIGRTFEQVTWKANYAAFGSWCVKRGIIASADLFVNKPELLAETQWAWLGGMWFFEAKGLWSYADEGDFQTVQVKVNGASPFPAGWTTRLNAYRAWVARLVKPAQLVETKVLDGPTVKRLQLWVGVAIDGAIGKVTYAALQKALGRTADGTFSKDDTKNLQGVVGAFVDGDWGPATTRALQRYLNAQN